MSPMPMAWRKVTSITPAGSAPVRCLTLEDPRGLYITTDGIVTHNSPAKPSLTGGENAAPLKYHDTPDAFADSQAGRDLLARLRETEGKVTAVALDHRSPIANVVSAFERAFKKRVVFVKGLSSDGVILDDAPGVIFANVEGENPIGFVMGAELRQRLEGSPTDVPTAEELGELFTSREEWNGISQDNADGVPSLYHTAARAANQMLEAMGMDQGLISSVLADYLKTGTVDEQAAKMIDDGQFTAMYSRGKVTNINPWHSEGDAFRNQNLAARALLTGSPLPAQLRGALDQTDRTRAMMNDGIASMRSDLEAALLAQAERNGTDFRTEALAIAPALVDDGQYGPGAAAAALASSTPAVQEAVRRSRNLIDQLSVYTSSIVRAAGNVELANTMMLNQGAWLKRYYAAFDPKSNWTYENLVELAASGGQTTNGTDATTILNDARRWYRNEYPTLTLDEINIRIAQLMNRDQFSASVMGQRPSGGKGEGSINSDVSSFQRRGEIPAEIRAVMGEETNPLMRFEKSGEFLTQFIARHETQQVMLALGMASGLFSATQDPIVYKATMPVDNLAWSGFIQPLQPDGSRAEVYTTSELMRALEDTYTTSDLRGEGLSGFMFKLTDLLAPLAREAKWNKVAGNPDSWAVNLIGGLIGAVQTGAVMSPHWRDAWNLMTSGKSLTDGEMAMAGIAQGQSQAIIATLTPQQLEEMRSAAAKLESRQLRNRLAGAGVTSKQYHLADIDNLSGVHEARLFQALEAFDAWNAIKGAGRGAFTGYVMLQGFGKVPATIAAAIGGAAGGFIGGERIEKFRQSIAEKLIGTPDLFWKLLDFSDNYAAHLAAGDTEVVAFQSAALKTLNSLPNYARTPAILQAMSKIGINSSFVGFQFEVWRNTFYQPIIAAREIASGRGPLMRRGIRRLAGTAAVAVGANFVVQGAAMALMKLAGLGDGEDDDEKRKAFQRSLAAPWDKNAILAFANLDPDKVTWMNTNYLVPQLAIGNVIRAVISGKDEGHAINSALEELKQQFMGGSVFVDPAIEAISGQRKSTGANISDEEKGSWAEKVDLTMHFLSAIYAPGAADKADRIARAINDRPREDRIFSLKEEMARFMGLRAFTRPTANLAEGAFRKIGADARTIDGLARKANSSNPVDKEARLDDYRQRALALRERVATLETDLSTIGFSDVEIKDLRSRTIGTGEAVFEIKIDTDERKAREKEVKALR